MFPEYATDEEYDFELNTVESYLQAEKKRGEVKAEKTLESEALKQVG